MVSLDSPQKLMKQDVIEMITQKSHKVLNTNQLIQYKTLALLQALEFSLACVNL